jgi:hypothetical protein
MIINPYLVAPSSAYDADAQAFFTAAGITDTTQKDAVNQLVTDIKGYGLWSKITGLYPFVGGDATKHSYNLKDTSQYQLTFLGGWTHSITGALANGVNGMADTGILPLSLNDFGFGFYGYKSTYEARCQMGAESGAGVTFLYGCFNSSASMLSNINGTGQKTTAGTYTNVKGFYSASRTDASTVLTRAVNDTGTFSVSGGSLQTSKTMYIGANNYASTGDAHCNTEFRGSFVGNGLTATESGNLKTAFDTFNATLSRTA